MKKILSIILTILMVANFGLFATVSADGEDTVVNFTGNGTNLLEIPVGKAQTTGTVANSALTLTAGQSVTYTINSNEATPVKFYWHSNSAEPNFDGTTYDLTINGVTVADDWTFVKPGQSFTLGFANNGEGQNTFNLVEGLNTVVFTLNSGTVSGIKNLYVADAEYEVAASGTTEVFALANLTNFRIAEYVIGGGNNYLNVWRTGNAANGTRWPVFDLDVEEAGNYDIFLPSRLYNGVNEFYWAVTVDPNGSTPVNYAASSTTVEEAGTYKVTVPLKAGKNTIRLEWTAPAGDFSALRTFSIAKAQAPAVNFAGNAEGLTGFGVANTLTTGTRYSGKVKLEAGQSITYKIVSDEATPVRLWWNRGLVTRSAVTYNLTINGEKVVNGAALSTHSTSGTTQIGPNAVNFVEGANDVVFEVVSGEFLEITTLYVADAQYTVGTESTVISTMGTVTSGYAIHENITTEGVGYRNFIKFAGAEYQVPQLPVYNLYVTEAGNYDVYLPTNANAESANEFMWTVTVNPDGAATPYAVNETVETAGTYKAATIPLTAGLNTIRLEWNGTKEIQSSTFTAFTLTKAVDPYLVTATVTGSIAEGLAVSADLSNHDGNQVMAIVAVYKIKDDVKQMVTSDVEVITATTTPCSLGTTAVTAEAGYTYEYKVFVWNATSLAPYPVEIN